MGQSGSNINIDKIDAIISKRFEQLENSLYHSPDGEKIEKTIKARTKLISISIKEKDIATLIALENRAIRSDMACYGAQEKRENALASLDQVARLIKSTSHKEGATDYLVSQNAGRLPASIPTSDLVQRFIKSHKAYLTHMIENTSSPALRVHGMRRKDALDVVKKEYEKNLNVALGKDSEKNKRKGLER